MLELTLERRAALRRRLGAVGLLSAAWRARTAWLNVRATLAGNRDERLPPPKLRTLVGGVPDEDVFLVVGSATAGALATAAAASGFEIDDPDLAVLDFGCGCGRTARHWARPVNGCDINPLLVEWCAAHLPGEWRVSHEEPPTGYAGHQFDLVYAVSVFTHLTVERQRAWLAELARIIRPGGLLMVSTHGDRSARPALTGDEWRDYAAGEIVVCHGDHCGGNLCNAYHPAGSLGRLGAEWFSVASHGGAGMHLHDLTVLSRRAP